MVEQNNDIDFNVLQLASSLEGARAQKWVAEISRVIAEIGGSSLVPTRITRSEPLLRRAGAQVIDEPLDEDKRSGASRRVANLAEENDVIAYIVHDLNILEMAIQTRRKSEAPIVFVMQNIAEKSGFFAKQKYRRYFDQVDHFICASEYLGDYLMEHFGVEKERLTVVYEGFDLKAISSQNVSQERTMSLAHSWGAVENTSDLVLIPAIYSDPQWCDNMLAFARAAAHDQNSDIRFIITGDDDGSGTMSRLENQIYKIASHRVQIAGHCADMEAAIKLTSTVLYLYSPSESQFSEGLIAQALGRFVFLPSECPAAGEFCVNGKTAKLLPNDAEVQLQEIQSFVKNEQDLREGNFVSSRSFIMQHFSMDVMHKRLRAIFEGSPLSE